MRRLLALAAALMALTLLLPLAATAQTTRTPRSQLIYFGAGCPPANPAGSCASTEYFLSRTPGESNVGNLLTAVAWGQRKAGNGYLEDVYSADETLNPTYVLQGNAKLDGQVVVGGYLSGGEFAVDSGVQVTITAHVVGTPSFERITLGSQEITKTVVTPGDTEYKFSFDIPAALDGVTIEGLEAVVGHDSLTALGNGFVDGSGGSSFRLRYYDVTTS